MSPWLVQKNTKALGTDYIRIRTMSAVSKPQPPLLSQGKTKRASSENNAVLSPPHTRTRHSRICYEILREKKGLADHKHRYRASRQDYGQDMLENKQPLVTFPHQALLGCCFVIFHFSYNILSTCPVKCAGGKSKARLCDVCTSSQNLNINLYVLCLLRKQTLTQFFKPPLISPPSSFGMRKKSLSSLKEACKN